MASSSSSQQQQQQQEHASGNAFFDSFFASALQRANMSSDDLKGMTQAISAAAHPLPSSSAPSSDAITASASLGNVAAEGHGLDCGSDPGPVEPVDAVPTSPTSAASTSSARQQLHHHREAQAAASALLSRSAHSSDSITLPNASLNPSMLAHTRGGGLGTPTGEKTYIGSSWQSHGSQTPVMDKDGLGWPAKATLDRLNHTAEQAAANEKRLARAVKTVLECLGEDPDRNGLKQTPERYAKALLWMTRGYEVRLSGKYLVFLCFKAKLT